MIQVLFVLHVMVLVLMVKLGLMRMPSRHLIVMVSLSLMKLLPYPSAATVSAMLICVEVEPSTITWSGG